jgi:hypothetical protein
MIECSVQDLKVCDNGILISLLFFWTLSGVGDKLYRFGRVEQDLPENRARVWTPKHAK